MNKSIVIGAIALATVGLVGCNDKEVEMNETKIEENKTQVEKEKNEVVKSDNSNVNEVTEKGQSTKEKIVTTSSHIRGNAWRDYQENRYASMHGAAIYKNSSSVPVLIKETEVTHYSKGGKVLGVASAYSVPSTILPGETAFVGVTTYMDDDDDATEEDYKDVVFNFHYESTKTISKEIDVLEPKGFIGDETYVVKGTLKNTLTVNIEKVRVAAALYGDGKELLGVVTSEFQVKLNPEEEFEFELREPMISPEVISDIKAIEVKAEGL